MSKFTSELGNPNDIKKFIGEMNITLNLRRLFKPNNSEWDNWSKRWIVDSLSDFSDIIERYDYLREGTEESIKEGIEKIDGAIKLCKTHIPTETGGAIPKEMLDAIEQLDSSISAIIKDYQKKQQYDMYHQQWTTYLLSLSGMQEDLTSFYDFKNIDSSDVSTIKKLANELSALKERMLAKNSQTQTQQLESPNELR